MKTKENTTLSLWILFCIVGFLLLVISCGENKPQPTSTIESPPPVQPEWSYKDAGICRIKIGDCWYICWTGGANYGGKAIVHAGDCDNPNHKKEINQ